MPIQVNGSKGNEMGVRLSEGDTRADKLTKIAQMAYGVKYGKGEAGGNGYVGMVGDKVVKFNTHLSERLGPVTESMRESCDLLRSTLYDIMSTTDLKHGEAFASLCKELGFGLDGKLLENRPLLSRKVVAKAVTELSKADSKLAGVWSGVKNAGVSTQEHTAYAELRKAEDLSSFNHLVEFRFNPKNLSDSKIDCAVFEPVKKKMTSLAENVYRGKTNLTDAFKSLGVLFDEIGEKVGNFKTANNLKSFSIELALVAVSGKRVRGLKPASAPETLTQSQLKTLDEAIGRTADRIMKDFEICRNDAKLDAANIYVNYKTKLGQGLVEDRDIMLEQIKAELYASDKFLEVVQKETDRAAMGQLHTTFQKHVQDELERIRMNLKENETAEESVVKDFPREINNVNLARQITINGENQEKAFMDDSMILSDEERNKIGGGSGGKEGGQRIAKNIIGLVPKETDARTEIIRLITTFLCPVSGPAGQCGMLWNLGYGEGYANLADHKGFGGTTDATLPSTTYDLRLEGGKITLRGKFDVGVTHISNQYGTTFFPKNRVTYSLEIPLNQKRPKSPSELQYTLYTNYSNLF